MPLYKNRKFQIAAILIIILLILNPTYTDFKEHVADKKLTYKRTFNGLIFSIYKIEYVNYYTDNDKWENHVENENATYLGVCKNFIKLNYSHIDSIYQLPTDTTIIAPDTTYF